MKVIVFGYSENPERYSHMAAELLKKYGHEVSLINPRIESNIELSEMITAHTLTMYVNSIISDKYHDRLVQLKIKRVIFNPGSENARLKADFETLGVEVIEGCTLVMLRTDQFD